jgi:NOL1/NOP2/sun family putative RNA methylase
VQQKDLPDKFLTEMKNIFESHNRQDEYMSFINSFSGDYVRGIRMNSLKVKSAEEFLLLYAKMNRELNVDCSDEIDRKEEYRSENAIDSKSENVNDCKSETVTDSKSETVTDSKSETVTDSKSETVTDSKSETVTDSKSETVTDNKSEKGQNKKTDSILSGSLEKVPWSSDGFYISNDIFPGRHPFYKAGVFYLQEPSAMIVAYVLDAKPGDMVLDICAAPGGKSVKIAADMKGEGVLFSNDINEDRVKALLKNIELAGCPNCIVLNETPANLSNKLEGVFDKILVDAPCSGEGMFRKDPNATKSWQKFGPDSCVVMQRDILNCVDKMLKPGGILVYSTCTFNTFENEKMIEWFLDNNSDYEVEPIEKLESLMENAGLDGAFSDNTRLKGAIRILPHKAKGEGHFCIKLRKKAGPIAENLNAITTSLAVDKNNRTRGYKNSSNDKSKTIATDEFSREEFVTAFGKFADELLSASCLDRLHRNFKEYLKIYNGHVYTLPRQIPLLDGLKAPKKGLYLGRLKQLRDSCVFEPSHSFVLSLDYNDFTRILTFSSDDSIITKYLKCETISFDEDIIDKNRELLNHEGYIAVAVDEFVLGWGKIMKGGMMKNLYPSGWVN